MEKKNILMEIEKKIKMMKLNNIEINEDDYLDYRGAGLNSIEIMILIVYLEEIYEIEISDEELLLDRYVYVRDLIKVVDDKI